MKIFTTAVVAGVVALSVMFTGPQLMTTSTAAATDFKPAVIYDMGGKFDKSFNEGVWNGVEKFTKETGVEVMEFDSPTKPSGNRQCDVWPSVGQPLS